MYLLRLLISFISNWLSHLFAWHYDWHKEPENIIAKRRELLETVAPNSRVLELGAGTGGTLTSGAYTGSAGRFAKLTLSEPDSGMRSRLKSKLSEHVTGVASGEVSIVDAALPHLPFGNGEFDAIVLFFVASHLADRGAAAHEIARVLAPGGKLLFLDHGAHSHDEGREYGHSHEHKYEHVGHGDGHSRPKPWFYECLSFLFRNRSTKHMNLDGVLKEFREESLLNETFQTRMEVKFFFKEVTYGIFTRIEEEFLSS